MLSCRWDEDFFLGSRWVGHGMGCSGAMAPCDKLGLLRVFHDGGVGLPLARGISC